MSKMGQEFEKNLDEAKYDMYEALTDFMSLHNEIMSCLTFPLRPKTIGEKAIARTLGKMKAALAKAEGK